MRSGDRFYVLGNVAKASFPGEQATITVQKYSAYELVISYKDLDKEATFAGRVDGNRILGNVLSNTSVGGKAVQLDGRWTALVVTDAMDFGEMEPHLPKMMNVCQSNDDGRSLPDQDCFTWSWDATSSVFTGNQMTVQRFDADEVVILGMSQHGTAVLAAYTGKITGNRIQGTVDYYSGDGHTWSGKWTASFIPIAPK